MLIALLLIGSFARPRSVYGQVLDIEMAGLASRLSKTLAAKGYKIVTVIDFTDLQGRASELGRYLAEQLSVETVSNGGVSMVDRANIKSILAEHKLTEEGLVNPANAKKLGEFAGVDAILTGSVTALDDGIVVMVKAIATSSATIVAAGRIKIPKSSEVQQLLNTSVASNPNSGVTLPSESGSARYQAANAITTKDLGPLRVTLKSVSVIKLPATGRMRERAGVRCTFEFSNLETRRLILVAVNANASPRNPGFIGVDDGVSLRTTLLDDQGTLWQMFSFTGISVVRAGVRGMNGDTPYNPIDIVKLLALRDKLGKDVDDPADYTPVIYGDKKEPNRGNHFITGSTSPIEPGRSVTVTMDFVKSQEADGAPTAIQISSELVIGIVTSETEKSYALQNLTLDHVTIPVARR